MVNDCSGFIEPLNLECIFINYLSGSVEIFMFVALIAIAGMGAYFRMLSGTMLVMIGLFAILMSQFLGGVYFLAVMITAIVFGLAVGRLVKR